jgi:glyoxylase-like metal-dependent hydrolase (beta-lactamase superfamily II)
MVIQAFPSGPFSTNAYLVACTQTNQAAIIDPAPESHVVIDAYLQMYPFTVTHILLTHSHWDHIADVAELRKQLNVPVYVHALDAPNLEKPGSDELPCWIPISGVKPDGYLEEGDSIQIGHLLFKVIHTPGHSPGSVCFYEPKQQILFSGDTLFKGTIGNLSFPTSQPDRMWESLDKLSKLPLQTKVYPGHGPQTTIGAESWLPQARQLFG